MKGLIALVDRIAAEDLVEGEMHFLEVEPQLSPSEYESHCAESLKEQGWKTRLTKSTGDQGVDIVAQRGGLTMVIQCKQYSSPVGNSAVQEVHAGKGFMEADLAAVVTNTSFTRSAKELAASLGVILVLDSELPEFDRILFRRMRDSRA